MDMQGAAKMLDEALVYYRCLDNLGYWNINSGKKSVGAWFGAELVRFQNLMTSNSFDAVGLISDFYNGTNMLMLRNAYSDYKSSGCVEGEQAVGKYEWTYDPVTQQAGFTTRVAPYTTPSGGSLLGDNKMILMIIAGVVLAMMWGNKGGGGDAAA
jgi:hypothetical protein